MNHVSCEYCGRDMTNCFTANDPEALHVCHECLEAEMLTPDAE